MVQCMNALVDKVQKQDVLCAHSDILHAGHNMATLFNNHPYIGSSGTLVDTNL